MEKEKYEPTPEEIEKAEEMAVEGEMTPEQEKMSKERSETFEAGFNGGLKQWKKGRDNEVREDAARKEAKYMKDEFQRMFKINFDDLNISTEVKEIIFNNKITLYSNENIHLNEEISNGVFIEFIEQIPFPKNRIDLSIENLNRLPGKDFLKAFFKRFPNGYIRNVQNALVSEFGNDKRVSDLIYTKDYIEPTMFTYRVHKRKGRINDSEWQRNAVNNFIKEKFGEQYGVILDFERATIYQK